MIDFLTTHENEHNKLFICPEGMLNPSHTITRFRTSAFRGAREVHIPIQPVVLIYDGDLYNGNVFDILPSGILKRKEVNVRLVVMDPIAIDCTEDQLEMKIEEIRSEMAKIGGFRLSRVENRHIFKKNTSS